jgi:pyridoxine 5-phosphate synthase
MQLGVNVDHIATVRQARRGTFPDPVRAALVCERSGADSIVAHLREDRRHIQDDDVHRLKSALKIKFNLEMAIHPSVLRTALAARPDTVTLVPERRKERTTESGLDMVRDRRRLAIATSKLRARGIEVSYFVDPIPSHIDAALACGAHAVEIHTGTYAETRKPAAARREAARIRRAVLHARGLGIKAHVGHGLDYSNTPLIASIPGIDEFNIGFSIIAESFFTGLPAAVKKMRALLRRHSPRTA